MANSLLIKPDIRNAMIARLLQEGTSSAPVQHWMQGAARVAQALVGGLAEREQEREGREAPNAILDLYERSAQQQQPQPAAMPRTPPPEGFAPPAPPQVPRGFAPPQLNIPNQRIADAFAAGGDTRGSVQPVMAGGDDPTMTIHPRQIAQANNQPMPPAGVPSPMPPAPAGPMPAPAQQPAPQPQAPAIPPYIRQMLNHPNATVRAYGAQMMQSLQTQQLKPQDYDIKTENGVTIAINKNNPRDRHIITDPAIAQSMLDFKAREQYATTSATERAKKDVAKPERDEQRQRYGGVVTEEIDRTIDAIRNPRAGLPATGASTIVTRHAPWTNAGAIKQLVDTVRSNVGFDRLQQMREASPTGGALGAVTLPELDMLQKSIGSLEQAQNKEDFEYNLVRVKNLYLDTIHGRGNGPREPLPSRTGSQAQQPQSSQGTRPRARNPQTGAVIEFDGSQWVPVR